MQLSPHPRPDRRRRTPRAAVSPAVSPGVSPAVSSGLRPAAPLAAAVAVAVGALGLVPSSAAASTSAATATTAAAPDATPVTIRPNPAYQGEPFEGWGTSLVWFANATGDYPADVRQDLYDKVFGEDGLDLNIARYNVGGGSASDVAPYLNDGSAVEGWWKPVTQPTAGTPVLSNLYGADGRQDDANKLAFLDQWDPQDPASYDLTADHTQRWWVDELTRHDQITHWETFSNSPPWFMTKSGYVSGEVGTKRAEQVLPQAEQKFAAYMAHVTQYLEDAHGIQVDTVDPFNEPNSGYWGTTLDPATGRPPTSSTQKQEGALINPAAQDRITRLLSAELARPDTSTDAVISAMDETDPTKFMANWNAWTPEAQQAVGQLNVHTYGTNDRRRVRDVAKAVDKPLWMSEVEGSWAGNPALGDAPGAWNRSNIADGLGMAGRIVDDLRWLEPNAWVFWQPVEDAYKQEHGDGGWGSVYIDFDCSYPGREGYSNRRLNDGDSQDDARCKVLTNQKYNTVRNFTHYIRPGDRLVPTTDAKTAAAVRADGTGASLVHYNDTASPQAVTVDLSLFGDVAPGATVTPVVTTKSPLEDVERNALVEGQPVVVDPATRTATLQVPAASVVTFVVDGASGVADGARPLTDGATSLLRGGPSTRFLTAGAAGALTIEDLRVDDAGAATQQWTAHAVPGTEPTSNRQAYVLRNGAGQVLVGSGGVTTKGQSGTATTAAMSVDAALADPAAHWILTTDDGARWTLVHGTAAVALDVSGERTAAGSPVALWSATGGANQVWQPLGADAFDVVGVEPLTVSTLRDQAPQLPTTATIRYRLGETAQVPVTWRSVPADTWKRPGVVTLTGTGTDPFGRPYTGALVSVVVGKIVATDPVSRTVPVGTTAAAVRATAPATVPGQVEASADRLPVPVTWDWSTLADASLATPGTRTVTGISKTPTGERAARLSVVVVATAARDNLCTDGGVTVTATYSENGYPAANVCDGSGSTRWSNWVSAGRTSDTLTFELGRAAELSGVTVTFAEKAPASATVRYRGTDGQWATAPAGTVTGLGTATPLRVTLPGVRATAVQLAVTMSRSYTKVAEVAIAGSVQAPSSEAGLGRLLVDGKGLEGFDPGTRTYTVQAPPKTNPVVSGLPLDQDANVAVTPVTSTQRVARVVVTAPDGTTAEYTVRFTS